jgi:antitoxin (DNA-binding transcriptional repressor) of toxin-antitoxin stability system
MSELAVEDGPVLSPDVAREAASGQVIYITEHGQRVAGIVPAELVAALERLSADELEDVAAAAAEAGHEEAAGLLEDLADRAAVLESRADPGPGVPWEQVRAEAGL